MRKIEGKDYSDWTEHDYKIVLIFYRWLRGAETYPEEIKWIKARGRSNHLLPEAVLTGEAKRMVECVDNLRDKASVRVLYESGCRIVEILTLRIKDVQFDEYGAVLIVAGKTGDRG